LKPLSEGSAPDIGSLTEILEKTATSEWIDALQRMYVDLMLSVAGVHALYYPALQPLLELVAKRADPARIADAACWLTRERALAGHPLNPKLLLHATLQRVAQSCLRA
jgi:DNA polymerase III subunit delta'